MPKTDIWKYGTQFGTQYSNEELQKLWSYYDKMTIEIQHSFHQWLHHVCNTYWLSYQDMHDKSREYILDVILSNVNNPRMTKD